MTAAISQRASWLYVPLLLVIVTFAWCAHYQRWSRDSWSIPVAFLGDKTWDSAPSSDAIWGMAATKARVDGEISFFNNRPISFGAPFRANWNEWLMTDQAVRFWWALLARAFGLFAGSNIALLSAHLLAALAFYFVCRHLRYDATFSFVGSILFGLSRYAFWRGLPHLTLVFYWHLPLVLLILWWCIRQQAITSEPKKLWLCVAVVILTGLQDAYYSAFFLQLLFWSAFYCFLRPGNTRRALLPLALAMLLLATVALANLDTFHFGLTNGSLSNLGQRKYAEEELYALRPVELFLPRSHALAALSSWTNQVYFGWSLYPGEDGSVYLGFVGILALAGLSGMVLWLLAQGRLREAPPHFWAIFLILCFSVVDGINGFFGLAGLRLLCCNDRYSIVILTILLLFGVRELHRLTRRWPYAPKLACAACLIALGIYDQLPPGHADQSATRETLKRDAEFVSSIEAKLPHAARLFQLPVCDFPENPQINIMTGYEQFRPYLHSRYLRFSYGDTNLDDRARWQREAEQLEIQDYEPRDLVTLLETYGFDAMVINRRGYLDHGVSLIEDLEAAGAGPVVGDSGDLLCIRLNPAQRPYLPPVFGAGWSDMEGDLQYNTRWSDGDATLVLSNGDQKECHASVSFGLRSRTTRNLKIVFGRKTLYEGTLKSGNPLETLNLQVNLRPGANAIQFLTNPSGDSTDDPNARTPAFAIVNFKFSTL